MRRKHAELIRKLDETRLFFKKEAESVRLELLDDLSRSGETDPRFIKRAFDLLLFIDAYPRSARISRSTRNCIRVFSELVRRNRRLQSRLANTGIPFTPLYSSFSADLTGWLIKEKSVRINADFTENKKKELSDVLNCLLPRYAAAIDHEGLSGEELLQLFTSRKHKLEFLLDEFEKISLPYLKDHLFEKNNIYIDIHPVKKEFSLIYNRLPVTNTYYHKDLLRQFDHHELIRKPVNAGIRISNSQRYKIGKVVKTSMILLSRETDTATYMDHDSIRYYELERGISIALYGMIPARQLSFESYVGYTLFKNGHPGAYGGAWIFGERAKIGINIFEQLRGGESGYAFCQLLRLFHHLFSIAEYSVEPYQFGLDNAEGIKSGSFWFYYKFGFRPVSKELKAIAYREQRIKKSHPDHRTSNKTLERFTESDLRLRLKSSRHLRIEKLNEKVLTYVRNRFDGNFNAAIDAGRKKIQKRLPGIRLPHIPAMDENILWYYTMNMKGTRSAKTMVSMSKAKGTDFLKYQKMVREILDET